MVYTCNGILFGLKKQGNSDLCCNIGEPGEHFAKWYKPGTKQQNTVWFCCSEVHRVFRFIVTSRMVVTEDWGKDGMGNCLMGRVSVSED